MPNIASATQVKAIGKLSLQSGAELASVDVAYEQYGHLSPAGDNAVLVCHALTGSARAAGDQGWWDPLIGPGAALDTNRFAVICSNFLASCYGTTGPLSIDPATGRSYGGRFPAVTVGDMVAAQRALVGGLGVRSLALVTGGSLGGLQVLEWAAQAPELVRAINPIACGLAHSAWCIAFNECARQAIRNDPSFHGGDYMLHGTSPDRGLALGRMVAMISYRSSASFEERFGRRAIPPAEADAGRFDVESYLHYQGDKLVERFDANAYLRITEAMDRFDVGQERGGAAKALAGFTGPALVLGIDSDILYPLREEEAVAATLRGNGNAVSFGVVNSIHGHDAFLMEWAQLDQHLRPFVAALR
ncbi:MAG: homoserine O-acetyltransferase [Dehalococcoidia bacterium]